MLFKPTLPTELKLVPVLVASPYVFILDVEFAVVFPLENLADVGLLPYP